MSKQTIDIGTTANDGTGDPLRTAFTKVNDNFDELYNETGWAQYEDTQYTDVSPFAIVADTDTILPNNAVNIIDSEKPSDVTEFYDGTVITGRSGDGIGVTIDMIVTPTSAGTTFIEIWLDITGGTGTPVNLANLYRRIVSFPKGNGVPRGVNFTTIGYTLGTWEANGAVVYVRANGSADIHAIRYIITRTHKAL